MEVRSKEEGFTEQGRETSVPVGEDGGRSGPSRSSTDDWPTPMVGDQAGVLGTETGRGREDMIDPFKRRDSIARSPLDKRREAMDADKKSVESDEDVAIVNPSPAPQVKKPVTKIIRSPPRHRTGSLPEWFKPRHPYNHKEVPMAPEERQYKKRREEMGRVGDDRDGVFDMDDPNYRLGDIVDKLDAEIKVIINTAKERNTKKEIKEAAGKLKTLMARLSSIRVQGQLRLVDVRGEGAEERQQEETREHLELIKENNVLRNRLKELRKENARLKESHKVNESQKMDEETIKSITSYDDILKLAEFEWPENLFKAVEIVEGSPLMSDRNADLVILAEADSEDMKNENIKESLLNRFPDAADLEGRLATLTVSRNLESREGPVIRTNYVFRAEVGNLEEWYGALIEIRNRMVQTGRLLLSVYPPGADRYGLESRKIAESIFREVGIFCKIYVERTLKHRASKAEAVLIKKDGRSYADLLKEIKVKMDPKSDLAKEIKTIRKTRGGDMLLVINNRNTGCTQKLKTEIGKIMGKEHIRALGGPQDKIIVIKDMDELVQKQEILEAILNVIQSTADDCKLGELRPRYGG